MPELLVGAALKSTILLALAGFACLALRRSSAALRHFVWSLAIVGALAMPLFSAWIPVSLPLPVSPGEPTSAAEGASVEYAPVLHVQTRSVAATASRAVAGTAPPLPSPDGVTTRELFPARAPGSRGGSAAPVAAPVAARPLWPGPGVAVAVSLLPWLWAVGCLVILLRLAVEMLRLHLLAQRATPIAHGRVRDAARLPALQLGLHRMPTLLLGNDDAIPMTWGVRRTFVLLPGIAPAWDSARLEAVLLHEFGHVKRRDFPIQLAARLTCALYWFHPLAWLAAHRLEVEREFACDDLVVTSGHEPFGYADSLVELARTLRASVGRCAVGSVAAGMLRPGQLRDRLVSILDDTRDRRPVAPAVGVAFAACTLALSGVIAAVAPAPAAEPPPQSAPVLARGGGPGSATGRAASIHLPAATRRAPTARTRPVTVAAADDDYASAPSSFSADDAWTLALCGKGDRTPRSHVHVTDDDGVVRLEVEFDNCRSSVEIRGKIEFARDFGAIARMERGSRVRMEVSRDGEPKRRLEARPGADGRPEYRWWIDGRERDFDADARAWLGEALLDMFRSSSYMADERAAWIVASGGAASVFAEVQAMSSDHVQGVYLEALLEDPAASPADVRRAVGLAANEIESDHALGKVLEAAATHSFDDATRDVWITAARRIQSDHTQGKVFEAALARDDLSTANLGFILDAVATDIESDHTKGKVYEGLLTHDLSRQAIQMLIRSAASIESDHTLSKLLEQVIGHDLAEAEQVSLLRVAKGIQSDNALGRVLRTFADRFELTGPVGQAFDEAVSTIDSSHERGRLART